ncbi:transcriptional regulator [Actinorhabdospora filicis]|uniref:Transcriptional regulator n=1 Tax=Actinorhabdospora filicis TaxID=1785913 RepID=A0A9W6SLJ7_9ACTN|nr:helix-turn-helix domain-containing protein [Actinorhabdospora filicis]GLZ77964.1 transcriptional regulator [Actinorhabdospora filicis]
MPITRRPGRYSCGLDATMSVLTGKWKMLILWPLSERPHRFGELRRAVEGVSEKVLAAQLRELEADGIVHREDHDEVPPRVEYSLTELGMELNEALLPLEDFGRRRLMDIDSKPSEPTMSQSAR